MNHAVICCTLISWASIVPAMPFGFVTNRQTANTHFRNFSLDFSMFVPVRQFGRDRCGTAREAAARTHRTECPPVARVRAAGGRNLAPMPEATCSSVR